MPLLRTGEVAPGSGELLQRLLWILRPDPNRSGRQYAFTALLPVLHGREHALSAAIGHFGSGPSSPFAYVPGLHFARLVILPRLIWEPADQKPSERLASQYLLFSSCSTGERDDHLRALGTFMPDAADAVFRHCVQYPGAASAEGFDAWLRHGQVRTSLFHAGYPHASPDQVRAAVALRDDPIAFAVEAQSLAPAAARHRYLQRFAAA